MGSIGFVEGAVDVAAPALHGRVSFPATVIVFTAFHPWMPYISFAERVSVLDNRQDMANPEDVKLMQGASYRNIRMVTEALDHGANVNAVTMTSNSGNTTLHIITEMGLPADNAKLLPIVTLLLSRGANPNTQNRDGTTPLMYATTSKNTETMKLLLDAGADATLRHRSGQTALNMARDLQFAAGVTLLEGRMQVSEPVVPVPPGPDSSNKELLLAALRGQLDKVKELLAAGADVNYWDQETYMTALMYATSREHLDVVNELIANRANLTMADHNGATALHIAASYGHVDILRRIIDALLEEREDLNTQDGHGRTALHMAAEGGMVNSVTLLLQRGADPAILDADGNTAADLTSSPELRALFPAPPARELPAYVSAPDADPVPIVFEVTKVQFKNQKVYDFEEVEEVPMLSVLSKSNSVIFKAKESYFTLPLATIVEAIQDGSQVRHKCKAQLEGTPYAKDVDMDHMYYYIKGNGNFLVWLDQIQQGLLQDFKIFDLTETDEELDNVASAQNVQTSPGTNRYGNAVNIVSADHCQAGTKQKVFKLNPVILTDEAPAPAPSSSGEKRRRAEDDASEAADILRGLRTGARRRTWKRKAGRKGRKTRKSRK